MESENKIHDGYTKPTSFVNLFMCVYIYVISLWHKLYIYLKISIKFFLLLMSAKL